MSHRRLREGDLRMNEEARVPLRLGEDENKCADGVSVTHVLKEPLKCIAARLSLYLSSDGPPE